MKILLFCPNWVGDAVMATPTIRAIRARRPDATITGLMHPFIADTLAGNPWIDQTILLSDFPKHPVRRWWSVARRLRRERFDAAILFTNNFMSAFVCAWAGIKQRIGYARELRGALLTDGIAPRWTLAGYTPVPLIDYYGRLAEPLGSVELDRQMELFLTERDVAAADRLWQKWQLAGQHPVIAIHPGAAFGPAKRWPNESFAELAQRLVDRCRARVVVLCGPAERPIARAIAEGSERSSSVHSMAEEEVSIGVSKAIVARADLLISTDSGPRHFAPAFGVPVVSLFGPTRIDWTDTFFPKEIHLQKSVPCGPCQQRVCPQGHHRCMKELSVEDVFNAAERALGGQINLWTARVA